MSFTSVDRSVKNNCTVVGPTSNKSSTTKKKSMMMNNRNNNNNSCKNQTKPMRHVHTVSAPRILMRQGSSYKKDLLLASTTASEDEQSHMSNATSTTTAKNQMENEPPALSKSKSKNTSSMKRQNKRIILDITNPKSLFYCVQNCKFDRTGVGDTTASSDSRSNNDDTTTLNVDTKNSDSNLSLALLKMALEYHTSHKRIEYIDSCTVSLSPVFANKRGNICLFAICQNNWRALKIMLNYRLTVDVFTFSMVHTVVNSIYAIQQLQNVKVNETVEMLHFLEQEFGPNIVYESINQRQSHSSRETPLHVACAIGCTHLIHLLLEHGASQSIRASDFMNQTPVHVALAHCDRPENTLQIVELLLSSCRGNNVLLYRNASEKQRLHNYVLKAPAQFRQQLIQLLRLNETTTASSGHCGDAVGSGSQLTISIGATLTQLETRKTERIRRKMHTLGSYRPRHLLHRIKNHHHQHHQSQELKQEQASSQA